MRSSCRSSPCSAALPIVRPELRSSATKWLWAPRRTDVFGAQQEMRLRMLPNEHTGEAQCRAKATSCRCRSTCSNLSAHRCRSDRWSRSGGSARDQVEVARHGVFETPCDPHRSLVFVLYVFSLTEEHERSRCWGLTREKTDTRVQTRVIDVPLAGRRASDVVDCDSQWNSVGRSRSPCTSW